MIVLAMTITGLTFLMVISNAAKFSHDWENLRDSCHDRDMDYLSTMRHEKQLWIMRHFVCAVFGVCFITYAVSVRPSESYDLLAKLAAVHVAFSLLSMFIESLFIMRIASVTAER